MLLVACGRNEDTPRKSTRTPPQPATPKLPAIEGKSGPIELLPSDGGTLRPLPITEYKQGNPSTLPDGLSRTAGAGTGMRAADKTVHFVIDGDPSRGFWFAFDENGNGDLRDDPRRELTKVGDAWELVVTQKIAGMFSGELIDAPARIRLRPSTGEMKIQQAISRRGTLALPGGAMQFALIGDSGQFGLDHHFLAFDLDRDGTLDLESLDNPELFHVFEKTITIDDASYSFVLDAAGSTLRLEPLAKKLPPRPPLTAGSSPPDISITDLDGKPATLAGLRGKVVLVDFWATSCQPCVAALPRIAELREKHHAAGFEVMSVAMDTPDVRDVLGAHRTGIAAISDAAQATYRVDRYPMYFLIARDGTIACSRCQLDKVEAMLAAELARK